MTCMTKPQTASRVAAYDIVRCAALLLVLLGHTSYQTIATPYGGIDIAAVRAAAGLADTAIHQAMEAVVSGIYTFHMRLFFALSGAVFYLRLRQGAYTAPRRAARTFLGQKARRLLVPFLVTALFYAMPLKAAAGCWAASAHPLRDILLGQFLLLGNSHLWFLAMLFGAFCLVGGPIVASPRLRRAILAPRPLRADIAAAALLLALLLACGTITHLAANRLHTIGGGATDLLPALDNYAALGWGTLWLAAGMLLERLRERLPAPRPAHLAAAALLCAALFLPLDAYQQATPLAPGKLPVAAAELRALALACLGVAAVWCLAAALARTPLASARAPRTLSRDSLGIYLFSDPLNYPLLASAALADPAVLIPARFAVTFLGGWAVTLVIRRLPRALQFL